MNHSEKRLFTVEAILERNENFKTLFNLDKTVEVNELIEAGTKEEALIKFYQEVKRKFPQYKVQQINQVIGPHFFKSRALFKMARLIPHHY